MEKQIIPSKIQYYEEHFRALLICVLVFQFRGRSDLFLAHHVALVSCLIHSVSLFSQAKDILSCQDLPKCCWCLFQNIVKILLSCSSYQNLYLYALNSVVFLTLSPCLAPWLQFSQVYLLYLPLMVRPIPFNSSSGVYLPCRTLCLELWNDDTFVKECCSMLFLLGKKYKFYIHLYLQTWLQHS